MNNGPEFIAYALQKWCTGKGKGIGIAASDRVQHVQITLVTPQAYAHGNHPAMER
ncbi:hypothetical protein VB734_00080 [Synechococcus sp. BA-124 BA4]|jgi:hypothetical protein|nr:hypothetical protein [Synechococcus sp. BA-124 BA4]